MSETPLNPLTRALRSFWYVLPFISLAAVLAYPFYKHIPIGLVLVLGGAVLAVLPRFAPGLVRSIAQYVDGLSQQKCLLLVFAIALLLRLPLIIFPAPPIPGDNTYYLERAESIVAGTGFGDYLIYPPGQSFWLAFWVWIFGPNLHVLAAVQCALSIATALIMYVSFARYSKAAACWSALFIAVSPSLIIWSGSMAHETTVTFLFSVIFFILTRPAFAQSPKLWILCGLLAGLTALVRPTMLVFPALLAAALVGAAYSLRKSVAPVLVTTLVMGLAIAPWTIRNYLHFHELVLISANFGVTLLSPNHPDSNGIYMDQMPSFAGKGLSFTEIDRQAMHMAIQSIKSNPWLFAKRSVLRIIVEWGGETSIVDSMFGVTPEFGQTVRQLLRAITQLAWVVFLCACCIGVARARTIPFFTEFPILWAVCLTALIFVIHSILEPISRHHLPVLPFLAGISLPGYGEWLVRKAMPSAVPR